ncbi:hypothetical protein [Streptomyces sp. NPDC089799]|uniref:hypothetical protein n=1 Tax=Streptomyces sp. NPDC089799 TaxID=3155066 RepID=UPI0034282DD3
MRTHQERAVALACAVVAAFALSACGSDGKKDEKAGGGAPPVSGSPSPGASGGPGASAPGSPAPSPSVPGSAEPSERYTKPVGQKRIVYLAGLKTVHPSLVADEEKALENGVQQCYALTLPGIDGEEEAVKRFSTPEHRVTDVDAIFINTVAKSSICPY